MSALPMNLTLGGFTNESIRWRCVSTVNATLNPTNYSAPTAAPEHQTFEIAIRIVFYVAAFLLDIVGNTIVLLIICINRKMRTTTNFLILNLAISDLMVGMFCMWVHVGNQVTQEWPFGPFVCKVNTFFQVLAVTSSVLTLTIISVERFIAIVFPLKAKFSLNFTGIMVFISWLVSICVAMPHLFVRRQYEFKWENRHEIWCDESWPIVHSDVDCSTSQPGKIVYYTIEGIIMYFVPIAVMIAAYSIIAIKLMNRKTPGLSISSMQIAQERSKRKVIKMLVLVLVLFVVCWTPQQFMLLWDIYRERGQIPEYVSTVKYIALYVAYLNSSLNPVLYGGFSENFRRGFLQAFKCILLKKRKQWTRVTPTTGVAYTNGRNIQQTPANFESPI